MKSAICLRLLSLTTASRPLIWMIYSSATLFALLAGMFGISIIFGLPGIWFMIVLAVANELVDAWWLGLQGLVDRMANPSSAIESMPFTHFRFTLNAFAAVPTPLRLGLHSKPPASDADCLNGVLTRLRGTAQFICKN